MRSRQTEWIISLFLVVGILLSQIVGGGRAAAGQDQRFLSANAELATQAYLPVSVSSFPLQTVFGAELGEITYGNGYDWMVSAGMTWVRRNRLAWSTVETIKGDRLWDAELEVELLKAAEAHWQVILIISSAPEWARADPKSACGPIKPEEYQALAAFVHDAVTRYSAPPFYVRYYEIWNEPDAPFNNSDLPYGCWGIRDDPYYGGQAYGELLNAVYPQLKSANPGAQELVGGLLLDCDPVNGLCNDSNSPFFLDGILAAGAGSSFDGISFHAYDNYQNNLGQYNNSNWGTSWNTTGPVMIAKIRTIQDKLAAAGVEDKYLVNTESAMIKDGNCDDLCEETKAYYVAQVYATAIAQDLKANVWFTVPGWRNSGLLNPNLTPKPAYTAYRFAHAELQDADLAAEIFLDPKVKGYQFTRRGQSILVLWSLDGDSHTVTLPWVPAKIWDVFGVAQAPGGTDYPVSIVPAYLERYP